MKTFLVHIDYRASCPARLRTALDLARVYGAHLIGLYVIEDMVLPFYGEIPMPAELLKAQQKEAQALADQAKLDFEALTKTADCSVEWRCIEGRVARQLVDHARYADLVIISQAGKEDRLSEFSDLAQYVVLHSARPVLLLPHKGFAKPIGKRVLVAWDGSHEAVRAVNDAMPLLQRADQVLIFTIEAKAEGDESFGSAIRRYLARHKVAARSETIVGDDWEAGQLLLKKATQEGMDLLVMGAYGHNRMMEFILGGATRYFLKHTTLPVLMSH